jgi:hypothetical protein
MSHWQKYGQKCETMQTVLREKFSANLFSINVSILITVLSPQKILSAGTKKQGSPQS